jgi:hypothetical protein
MSPSRCFRLIGTLLSAAILLSFSSQSQASINWAGTLLVPSTMIFKSCSGAFRFAARDGNEDIAPVSPIQAFAADRRFARTRYAGRAMAGLEPERSRLFVLTSMCGSR